MVAAAVPCQQRLRQLPDAHRPLAHVGRQQGARGWRLPCVCALGAAAKLQLADCSFHLHAAHQAAICGAAQQQQATLAAKGQQAAGRRCGAPGQAAHGLGVAPQLQRQGCLGGTIKDEAAATDCAQRQLQLRPVPCQGADLCRLQAGTQRVGRQTSRERSDNLVECAICNV